MRALTILLYMFSSYIGCQSDASDAQKRKKMLDSALFRSDVEHLCSVTCVSNSSQEFIATDRSTDYKKSCDKSKAEALRKCKDQGKVCEADSCKRN